MSEVVALDCYGRTVAVIPAHEGQGFVEGMWSWDMAAKWAYLAAKRAERELPPPCWETMPVHDAPAAP